MDNPNRKNIDHLENYINKNITDAVSKMIEEYITSDRFEDILMNASNQVLGQAIAYDVRKILYRYLRKNPRKILKPFINTFMEENQREIRIFLKEALHDLVTKTFKIETSDITIKKIDIID